MAFGKDKPEALHSSIGDTVPIVERSFILDIGSSILQLQLVTKNENLHSFNVLNLHLILSFVFFLASVIVLDALLLSQASLKMSLLADIMVFISH